jgi:Leucine-rich repeat (LRR) protein
VSKDLLSLSVWACPGIGAGNSLNEFIMPAAPKLRSVTIELSKLHTLPAFLKKATSLKSLGLRVNDLGLGDAQSGTSDTSGTSGTATFFVVGVGAPPIPPIRRLNLDQNSFSSVPAWAIALNTTLEFLRFSNCDSQRIEGNTVCHEAICPNICGDSPINVGPTLPPSLGRLGLLRELAMDCQSLQEVSVVGDLTSLQNLRLLNNELIRVPDSFAKLTRLKKLSLSGQFGNCACVPQAQSTNEPYCGRQPNKRECLYEGGCSWSCNNDSSINDARLSNLKVLTQLRANLSCLDLRQTQHTNNTLPAEFAQLTALTALDISHAGLRSWTPLESLTSLSFLR